MHIPRPPTPRAGDRLIAGLGHSTVYADLDFETYSEAGYVWDAEANKWAGPPGAPKGKRGLTVVGAAAYATHPTTEVLSLYYDLKRGEGRKFWKPGLPLPHDLFAHVAMGFPLEAHNSGFEHWIWNHVCVPKYGWPRLPQERLRCSMAKARAHGLPGALGELGRVLGIQHQKDADGERLLKKFSMPRNPTKADARLRIRPEEDPEDGPKLYAYNERDIVAESEASGRVPDMMPLELQYWLTDQRINYRGVQLDMAAVHAAIAIIEQAQARYNVEFERLTGIDSPSKLQQFKGWLAAHSVYVDSLDEDAIDEVMARPNLPEVVRRPLELRALVGSASVKKVFSMRLRATSAGRIHDMYNFHGARTGRPTGEGVQSTNLPKAGPDVFRCSCGRHFGGHRVTCPWCGLVRPPGKPGEWTPEAMFDAIEVVLVGSLDWLEAFFGEAMLTLAGCLRGFFIAKPGHTLVSSDFTAIEGVVIACLAGEAWRVKAYDEGAPMYLLSAERAFGVPLDDMLQYAKQNGRHHPLRQVGKGLELACLAPETQVLTDAGYVSIVDVTLDHLLWDGTEWVRHAGLVPRGEREVVDLGGVRMTPEHKVLCGTFWRGAAQLALFPSTRSQALATGSANLPLLTLRQLAAETTGGFWSSAVAAQSPIWSCSPIYEKGRPHGAASAGYVRPRVRALLRWDAPPHARTTPTAAGFSGAFQWPCPAAAIQRTRSGATMAHGEYLSIQLGKKTERSSWLTSSRFLGGTAPTTKWTESITTEDTSPEIFDSCPGSRTWLTAAAWDHCKRGSRSLSAVFDIAHAGPRNRFTVKTDDGHLIVHNCGFGGWISSAKNFNVPGADEEIKESILKWRAASPAVVHFWGGQFIRDGYGYKRAHMHGLEGMAIMAVQNPGTEYPVDRLDGTPTGISFRVHANVLYMRLPSGRTIDYHRPQVRPHPEEWRGLELTFEGWNSNAKKGAMGWMRMQLYGGLIAENAVQATARDIQMNAIENCERNGYPVVMHTYDEIVAEVEQGSVEQLETLMTSVPSWAAGWPIKAAGGWIGERYRKG